jgi:hypothetical protein
MMYRKPMPWEDENDQGEADSLMRTSRAYVAYGDKTLKEGILSCFKLEDDGHYQGYRCYPDIGRDDVSRDQTIGALTSLLINGDIDDFNRIAPRLRYKLSKRYSQGLGISLWIKQWWWLYGIVEIISIVFGILWNKILYKLMDIDISYSEQYYMQVNPLTGVWVKRNTGWCFVGGAFWANNGNKLNAEHRRKKDTNWWYRFLDKTEYPLYGAMLTVFMVHSMPNSFFKKILTSLLLWNVKNEENLLVSGLLKNDLTKKQVDELKPMAGFRWTNRMNGTCSLDYLKGDNAKYNTFDKDILYKFVK